MPYIIVTTIYQTGLANITAAITKEMPGNKTIDICYGKHFHITSTHGHADHFLCFVTWTTYGTSSVVSLSWLIGWLGEETTDGLRQKCRLSRRVAPSSSQSGLRRLLQGRPLMMAVLRASTNFPTDGLLLDPQSKQIAPNVFCSPFWFRFQVSSYLNFSSSFTLLHTCWTAAIVINHPVCDESLHIPC
jgi:hypothetical protein